MWNDTYTIEKITQACNQSEYNIQAPRELSQMKVRLWSQVAKKKREWMECKEVYRRDKAREGAEMKAEEELYTDSKWNEKVKSKYTDSQINNILDDKFHERKIEVIAKWYEYDEYSNLRQDLQQLISSIKMELENTNLEMRTTDG